MWHQIKQWVKAASGINDQMLHVLLGIALYLIVLLVLRRPWTALAVVAVVQLVNEAIDLAENITGGGLAGAANDTFFTLAPAALIALAAAGIIRRPARD